MYIVYRLTRRQPMSRQTFAMTAIANPIKVRAEKIKIIRINLCVIIIVFKTWRQTCTKIPNYLCNSKTKNQKQQNID